METRQGVTLIEALFVLGIMAILIGMVMVLLSQNTDKEKNNETITEFETIRSAVSSLCDGQSEEVCGSQNAPDLSSALAKNGLIPNKYVSGSNIVDPFGSAVSNIGIKSTAYSGGNADGFNYVSLTTSLHSKSECFAVISFETQMESYKIQNTGQNLTPDNIISECASVTYPISVEINMDN